MIDRTFRFLRRIVWCNLGLHLYQGIKIGDGDSRTCYAVRCEDCGYEKVLKWPESMFQRAIRQAKELATPETGPVASEGASPKQTKRSKSQRLWKINCASWLNDGGPLYAISPCPKEAIDMFLDDMDAADRESRSYDGILSVDLLAGENGGGDHGRLFISPTFKLSDPNTNTGNP